MRRGELVIHADVLVEYKIWVDIFKIPWPEMHFPAEVSNSFGFMQLDEVPPATPDICVTGECKHIMQWEIHSGLCGYPAPFLAHFFNLWLYYPVIKRGHLKAGIVSFHKYEIM